MPVPVDRYFASVLCLEGEIKTHEEEGCAAPKKQDHLLNLFLTILMV